MYIFTVTDPCDCHHIITKPVITDGSKAVLPEVMVLKGGFEAWEALCGGDEGMVEPLGDGGDGVATK